MLEVTRYCVGSEKNVIVDTEIVRMCYLKDINLDVLLGDMDMLGISYGENDNTSVAHRFLWGRIKQLDNERRGKKLLCTE